MATFYVYSGATGANDGLSQTDAWTDIQSAVAITAGDTLLFRGTQTLAASLVWTGVGAIANKIRVVGVNSSWVEDGTRAIINGNSAATYCSQLTNTQDYFDMINIEAKNATANGFSVGTGANGVRFVNCISHNNGGLGWFGGGNACSWSYCRSYSNSGAGWDSGGSYHSKYKCIADNNTGLGMDSGASRNSMVDCLSFDNGGDGFELRKESFYSKLTAHGNSGDGIFASGVGDCILHESRATSNGVYGFEVSGVSQMWIGSCYAPATGQPLANTTNPTNGTIIDYSSIGIWANDFAGTDADGGYTDSSSDDYDILSTASIFGQTSVLLSPNTQYSTAGTSPNPSQGGSSGNAGRSYPRGVA